MAGACRSQPLYLACTSSTNTLPVRLQMFAELYQCPDVLIAHHAQLNGNKSIEVGRFEEGCRNISYSSPWDCTSKALKRAIRKSAGLQTSNYLRKAIPLAVDARVQPVHVECR